MGQKITLLPNWPNVGVQDPDYTIKAITTVQTLSENVIPEMNVLGEEIESNALTAASAATVAEQSRSAIELMVNFQGDWSAQPGSTPATEGETFRHQGQLWALLTDLSDVTQSEPGLTNPDWKPTSRGLARTAKGIGGPGSVMVPNADGTASAATGFTDAIGSESVFANSSAQHVSTCYAPDGKIYIAYRDDSDGGKCKVVVGTLTGVGVSYGDPVEVTSGGATSVDCCYDTVNNKLVVAYVESTPRYRVGSPLSGNNVEFPTGTGSIDSGASGASGVRCCFDDTNSKVAFVFSESNQLKMYLGSVTGTSVSIGGWVQVGTGVNTRSFDCCFVPSRGHVAIVWGTSSPNVYVASYSLSGSQPLVIDSESLSDFNAYISNGCTCEAGVEDGQVVAFFIDADQNNSVFSLTAVLDNPITIQSVGLVTRNAAYDLTCAVDPGRKLLALGYRFVDMNDYGAFQFCQFGKSGVIPGAEIIIHPGRMQYSSVLYHAAQSKFVYSYRDTDNSGYGTTVVIDPALNGLLSGIIGLSETGFIDSGTVSISTSGMVNSALTNLTPGATYYVDPDDATLTTAVTEYLIGVAISETEMLIK